MQTMLSTINQTAEERTRMSSALESREHELKRCSAAAPMQPLAAHTARRHAAPDSATSATHLSVARRSNS